LEGFLNLFQAVIQDRYLHVGMPPEYSKLPSSASLRKGPFFAFGVQLPRFWYWRSWINRSRNRNCQ